ncbi:hypothetical protein TcasGA2_TC034962, partial [Tribolium castaneum]
PYKPGEIKVLDNYKENIKWVCDSCRIRPSQEEAMRHLIDIVRSTVSGVTNQIVQTNNKIQQRTHRCHHKPRKRKPDELQDKKPETSQSLNQRNDEKEKDIRTKVAKKSKQDVITGTARVDEADGFRGARKMGWLFVGRATSTTTEDKVSNYLKQLHPDEHFTVEELPKHINNKSQNKSFKVGLRFELVEEMMKPESWPENLTIQRFKFFSKTPTNR